LKYEPLIYSTFFFKLDKSPSRFKNIHDWNSVLQAPVSREFIQRICSKKGKKLLTVYIEGKGYYSRIVGWNCATWLYSKYHCTEITEQCIRTFLIGKKDLMLNPDPYKGVFDDQNIF
jgi:hypothetical protein